MCLEEQIQRDLAFNERVKYIRNNLPLRPTVEQRAMARMTATRTVSPEKKKDKRLKTRFGNRGQYHWSAVLTPEKVIGIRRDRRVLFMTYKALGEKYGCSAGTAQRVVYGGGWKHVIQP